MKIKDLHTYFVNSSGVCTDTRKITENCMFFALKGDNFNGNKFAIDALNKGAKYAVIDEKEYTVEGKTILVENVLEALQKLANFHRKESGLKIVSLTGSNGKTTTKELINTVLSQSYTTTATIGNLNNHIGVPLTLLSMNSETEIGIVEMGANHQKEIEFLCSIANPDFGYITNFGKAHLEGFGGVEGVIKGKSELYNYLKDNSKTIFLNTNNDKQVEILNNYKNVYSFGENKGDVCIQFIEANPFVTVKVNDLEIKSHLIGSYNFSNICAAIAIGSYFNVPLESIKKAIESYIPSNNRSQIISKGTNKIILDAYNANPTSMKAALENYIQLSDSNKIAILGDMFELGESAANEHQEIADFANYLDFEELYLVGENFHKTNNTKNTYPSFEALKLVLEEKKYQNKTFLIKGSRGMALERCLEFIQ